MGRINISEDRLKTVWLLRHPQTEQNISNVQQTFDSSNYSEEGKKQYKKVLEWSNTVNLDKIYSSDSPRCESLAQEINKDISVSTKLLRDKFNGDYEGIPNNKIDWSEINKMPFLKRRAPNGESIEETYNRIKRIFAQIKNSSENNVLIISHSVPIRLVVGLIKNISVEESIIGVKYDNGALTKIIMPDKIEFYNKRL